MKTSTTFPVGVTTLPIGPTGRVSVFNGLIDGLNSQPDSLEPRALQFVRVWAVLRRGEILANWERARQMSLAR